MPSKQSCLRIHLDDPLDIEFGAEMMDITTRELVEAAQTVGTSVHTVGAYLGARPFVSKTVH